GYLRELLGADQEYLGTVVIFDRPTVEREGHAYGRGHTLWQRRWTGVHAHQMNAYAGLCRHHVDQLEANGSNNFLLHREAQMPADAIAAVAADVHVDRCNLSCSGADSMSDRSDHDYENKGEYLHSFSHFHFPLQIVRPIGSPFEGGARLFEIKRDGFRH